MSAPTRAELLVVGAGPVGLYAAYYAGYRGLDTLVIDALPRVGGQVTAFYPDRLIYDVPGFPAVRGDELVARLHAQARAFPIAFRLGEEIGAIEAAPDGGLTAHTRPSTSPAAPAADERRYTVRAVLLATGIGRLAPQRRQEKEIAPWEGRGLDYRGDDLAGLAGRRALVVGGAARAVELALDASAAGATVALAHRRERLAIDDALRDRLVASPIELLPFQELVALRGGDRVAEAVLEDRRDASRRSIPVDAVLPCYGFAADAAGLAGLGVALEGDAVPVDSRMASSRERVFAAGDAATYPGKVRLLAADFGEACTAINNIAAQIVPGARLFPGYSSHSGGTSRRPSRPTP